MTSLGHAALVSGTIATGLVAGIFVAFWTSIMPGLAKTDDATFVHAMQEMNTAILNPVFLVLFVLPAPALGVAVFTGPSRAWVIAALVLYLVCFAITSAGNVPLNDELMEVDPSAGASVVEAGREAFEATWNRLHVIRTLAVVASFGCCVGAAMTR
ncbi:hypothetical protein ASG90_16425 [Nocardioides sp. Soil797]|nr:hypothetical protein ASG90_16425 [Nocardioides sp. Soil797]